VADKSQKVAVDVDGRHLTLSNLAKVLYPDAGFAKGEVIDYYSRIAPVLLPHLADRPLTVKRYPNGVEGNFFFEKNAPKGTPSWVRTVTLPVPGSTMNRETIDFVVVEELATLVWLANLAALELHVPQWRVPRRARKPRTDVVVFDLDPGPPATIVECCRVALLLQERLGGDGLEAWPKTSGNKGAQLYVPIEPATGGRTSEYAKALAARLAAEHPDLVVSTMNKAARKAKVFIDWSQNNPAKTTIAPYSLRGTDRPQVSTPLTWDEVEAARSPEDLVFGPADVQARLEEIGDLLEPMREVEQSLPDG
jgi:bifunctional non-homologous end joining protein LigD